MSLYSHRMTLAVPQLLMPQANQLALIAGESPDDVNTFTAANWQDADGNLYAVCSTVVKPIVVAMFGQAISDTGLTAEGADKSLAQQALDSAVLYKEGVELTPDKIMIAIDYEPLPLFEALKLTQVTDELEPLP